jgi:hypothetical protein
LQSKIKDCGFFKWLDDPAPEWYTELLRDLRDMVWRLKKEAKQGVASQGPEAHELNQFLQDELMKKDAALEAKEKELEEKVQEVEALKAMIKKQNGWPRFLCCLGLYD